MGMDVPVTSLGTSKERLEELKALKGRLSRQVEDARQQGANADGRISELQAITSEIKQLQKALKQQLNNAAVAEKWVPPHIAMPSSIGHRLIEGPVEVRVCTSAFVALADAYVGNHAAGSVWHRPQVTDFVRQTFGHKTRYLCAFDESRNIVGVLPIVQLCSRLFGNFLVSVPYFNYGGLLADNADVAGNLLEAGSQWREDLGARHLELRFSQDHGLGLPKRTDKVTFWLPLPDNTGDLWRSFQPKIRAQIRRGERELTEYKVGGEELLDAFYRVFAINMRDLGTPVYGKDFFRNLLRALPKQSWLVVVRVDNHAVGCAFLTGYRGRMEIPWASTLRSHNHTGVNRAMYWHILQFAIERGYGVFDFGRCSESSGTYRFKQQWGAQPLPLCWDYLLPEGGRLPALTPDNPKFRLLIAAWQRLPVWLANLIGPHIVKDLP